MKPISISSHFASSRHRDTSLVGMVAYGLTVSASTLAVDQRLVTATETEHVDSIGSTDLASVVEVLNSMTLIS